MSKSILVGVAAASCGMILSLAASASAQEEVFKDTNTYASCQDRFAVIFPGNPSMRDVPYAMRSGRSAAARQHYLERGADRFSVTVVVLANAPAVDEEIINHAADILRKKGEVRADYPVGYIAGVRGRQLLIAEPNGRQLRGSVYMHDHRIYITEASTAVGDFPGLQFDQSLTIIDAGVSTSIAAKRTRRSACSLAGKGSV